MNYGLYLSAQGAAVQSRRMDVIANNVANAQTTSFKRDLAIVQSNPPYDRQRGGGPQRPHGLNDSTGGATVAHVVTDFSNGTPENTGGAFDLAILGPGFFRVSDGRSEFLTRDGRLTTTPDGELVTANSRLSVLSEDGAPILIPADATSIQVSEEGLVEAATADGGRARLGRLALVSPASPDQLRKVGDTLFANEGPAAPAGPEVQVQQGFLESSGTKPVVEMLRMIEASRAFETNVTMIQYADESLGRLLQAVPRR